MWRSKVGLHLARQVSSRMVNSLILIIQRFVLTLLVCIMCPQTSSLKLEADIIVGLGTITIEIRFMERCIYKIQTVRISGLFALWYLIYRKHAHLEGTQPLCLSHSKQETYYAFCCSLPENILSLTPTSNSLTQKYIHFIQSTFISVDTQPFASKGIP